MGLNGEGGEVIDCINNINVSGEYKLVGGIVGYSLGGNIENCKNYGEIRGPAQVGGIAGDLEGLNENNIVILKNCINYGKITGDSKNNYKEAIGGITGINYKYSILENNINEGTLQSNTSYTGGISGANYYTVKNCVNKGNVQSIADTDISIREIGGIVGKNRGIVRECYNTADIMEESSNINYVGGIAGLMNVNELYVGQEEAVIEKCYNTGNVSGNNYIGGIVGRLENGGNVNSCYNIRKYNWKYLCRRSNWNNNR